MKRIIICGPESSGKTSLASALANFFKCPWVPEYARNYISGLHRAYEYSDLEHIALRQMVQYLEYSPDDNWPFVFYDTHLIITQVWFEEVYGSAPWWLRDYIKKCHYDHFLLCAPDLPWEADGIRENPGVRREELYFRYQVLIKSYGFSYSIVRGKGEARLNMALSQIS
ncbi:MAG: ATP-binding protein [Spirochaetales bacterium]|nr:ATP-binding protein [Spirochaetales bacterium]